MKYTIHDVINAGRMNGFNQGKNNDRLDHYHNKNNNNDNNNSQAQPAYSHSIITNSILMGVMLSCLINEYCHYCQQYQSSGCNP